MAPMWDLFADPRCIRSTSACLLLAITYVGSLYIWRTKNHRDHPSTIKKRFISVFVMSGISPLFVLYGTDFSYFRDANLLTVIGIRSRGLLHATFLPLLLTMVLFSGPLMLHYLDGVCSLYFDSRYWSSNIKNLIWLRNHLVAPFSEEFTFRASMLPILVPCFGPRLSVIVCPLFFGVAHLHHLRERLQRGTKLNVAIRQSLFQFAYTTVFGAYSAYLFLRTGHFMAPFIAHAFCNHMGFPDVAEVVGYRQPMRTVLCLVFLLGLGGWVILLQPLTHPRLYDNTMYV